MNKTEKLIIVGKSGAGKNFLYDKLKVSLPGGIKYTTRPCRQKEVPNIDYYFIEDNKYNLMLENNKFFINQSFKIDGGVEVKYGLSKEEFDKKQLFIFTPGEIQKLDPETRKKCFIVYLDVPREVRESRLLVRNDQYDSLQRRFLADDEDFKNFKDYDLKLSDSDYDTTLILSLMF
jgi:guanylate kinase